MKKIIISLVLIMSSLYILAQDMRFSVFVDPQLTWLSPDSKSVSKDGSKLGIDVGLGLDKFFADNYAISTGLSLSSIGGFLNYDEEQALKVHGETDTIPAGSTLEYKLQYINIPLGLKLKTNEIGYFTYFAHLGLDAGINIKALGSSDLGDFDQENISDEVRFYRVGYYIGGGAEYSLGGNSALIVGITYSNGFTDITKDNDNKAVLGRVSLRIGVLF